MPVAQRITLVLALAALPCQCLKPHADNSSENLNNHRTRPLASLLLRLHKPSLLSPRQSQASIITQNLHSRMSTLVLTDGAPEDDNVNAATPTPTTPTPSIKNPQRKEKTLEGSFYKNFGDAEKTKKTATKVGKTLQQTAFWKNPVVFWSIAGTAALFVPIICYVISK